MELSEIELNHLRNLLIDQKDEISLGLIQKLNAHDAGSKLSDPTSQMKQLRIELSELMRNMRKFDPSSLEGHQMSEKAEQLIAAISELEMQLQQGN